MGGLVGVGARRGGSGGRVCGVVLGALRSRGLEQVIVVPLSGADTPVAIARVIVPGLEGPSEPDKAPGKRGAAVSARGKEAHPR